jgi:hypothetical protein
MSIFDETTLGESYRINLVDGDGDTFSTADGRITVASACLFRSEGRITEAMERCSEG